MLIAKTQQGNLAAKAKLELKTVGQEGVRNDPFSLTFQQTLRQCLGAWTKTAQNFKYLKITNDALPTHTKTLPDKDYCFEAIKIQSKQSGENREIYDINVRFKDPFRKEGKAVKGVSKITVQGYPVEDISATIRQGAFSGKPGREIMLAFTTRLPEKPERTTDEFLYALWKEDALSDGKNKAGFLHRWGADRLSSEQLFTEVVMLLDKAMSVPAVPEETALS